MLIFKIFIHFFSPYIRQEKMNHPIEWSFSWYTGIQPSFPWLCMEKNIFWPKFTMQALHARFPNHCIFYDFFIVSINHRNLKATSAMPNNSGTYLSFVLYSELYLSLAIMDEEGELQSKNDIAWVPFLPTTNIYEQN